MEIASESTPARVTVTKTRAEVRVAKQVWLESSDIGTVKVLSNITGLLYFERTETVVQQEHRMPARGVMEVRLNVLLVVLVSSLTIIPVHAPKQILL